jgi:hypothetical protein
MILVIAIEDPSKWDAATWANLLVAVGTGALAIATFKLGKQAKTQADATVDLVRIAEQDLAATATPQIVPVAATGEATGGWSGAVGLTVTLRNLGGANAEYQSASLRLGNYSELGKLHGSGPVIKPNDQFTLTFPGRPPPNQAGTFEVQYQGPGSGVRRQTIMDVRWRNDQIFVNRVRHKNL